jgi:ABC-type multidrug transport system ATPase subunit
MGFCPQYDVIFDNLTVSEHIKFVCGIKRVEENMQLTKELGLDIFRNRFAKELSGGQKRALTLLMALFGEPRLLFLDEPTSGMDPLTRRSVWSILKSLRKKCYTLLTTHSMDEADLLADKIVILKNGQLHCSGTSLSLKRKFGLGYTISILFQSHVESKDKFTSCLKQMYSSDIKLISDSSSELKIILPAQMYSFKNSSYSSLFKFIESKRKEYYIESYSITYSSLEDVFLNLSNSEELDEEKSSMCEKASEDVFDDFQVLLHEIRCSNIPERHFTALVFKQWIFLKREFKLLIGRAMVCIAYVIMLIFFIKAIRVSPLNSSDPISLQYSESFFHSDIFFGSGDQTSSKFYNFFENHASVVDLGKGSRELFEERLGEVILNRSSYVSTYFSESSIERRSLNAVLFVNESTLSSYYAINFISNALTENFTGRSIEYVNYPFPFIASPSAFFILELYMPLFIGIGLGYLPSVFGLTLLKEKRSMAKSQQLIAGLNIFKFWLSCWISHIVQFMFLVFLIFVIFELFGVFSLIGNHFTRNVALFAISGSVSICFNFFLINLFVELKSYLIVFSLINMVGSNLAFSLVAFFFSAYKEIPLLLNILHLFPNLSLMMAIFFLAREDSSIIREAARCSISGSNDECSVASTSAFNHDIATLLVWAFFSSIFWYFMACVQDLELFKSINKQIRNEHSISSAIFNDADQSVLDEKARISFAENISDDVVLDSVKKTYVSSSRNGALQSKEAIKMLSFGISTSECFGLLGPNGAGKSTTVNLITAQDFPSEGSVYVTKLNVNLTRKYRSKLGFCPQNLGLFENFTTYEHLKFYFL